MFHNILDRVTALWESPLDPGLSTVDTRSAGHRTGGLIPPVRRNRRDQVRAAGTAGDGVADCFSFSDDGAVDGTVLGAVALTSPT